MTHERFFTDHEGFLTEFDWETNEYIDEWGFGDGEDWERLCKRLNQLYEENSKLHCQLKRTQNQLMKLADFNVELIEKKGGVKNYR